MKSQWRDYWIAGFAAIILAAVGAVTIFQENAYGLAFLEQLPSPFSKWPSLALLGGSAVASAVLLLFRCSRSIGWIFTGVIGSAYLIAAFLVSSRFPNGFFLRGNLSLYPITWLYWAAGGLLFIAAVLALIHDNSIDLARVVYQDKIEQLNLDNQRLSDSNKQLVRDKVNAESAVRSERDSVQRIKDNHEAELAKLKAVLDSEEASHRRTKKLRPYESQLVAAFSVSLALKWQQREPNSLFSLNHFQGNLDKNFGDFVGLTAGTTWLVELKRDWSSVARESDKPVRKAQKTALCKNQKLGQVAAKCHWLGWGAVDSKEASLHFSPYWHTWKQASPPTSAISHYIFVERAFSKVSPMPPFCNIPTAVDAVGVTPSDFAEYIHFLAQNTGECSDADSDVIAALIFQKDQNDNVRYWVQRDLLSFAKTILEKYKKIDQSKDLDEVRVVRPTSWSNRVR